MKVEQLPVQLTGYDFLQEKQRQKRVEENQKVANDYFQNSNEYQGEDTFGYRLDLSYLLGSKDGFLSGSLSDEQDVDYYRFSIASFRNLNLVEKYNKDILIHLDDIPDGCQYEIVLYDKEGNQVGIGKDNGRGGKSISIPSWDNSTEFCIKVFTMDGAESRKNYHLSFETIETKEDSGAYLQNKEKSELLGALRYKLHTGQDCSKEREAIKAINGKYESNYQTQLAALQKQQAEEFKLQDNQKSDLLESYAKGEELSIEEKQYLMVYANAYEQDQASVTRQLNQKIVPELSAKLGDMAPKGEIIIQIKADGEVFVKGEGTEAGKKLQQLLEKHFSGVLWKAYLTGAEEISKMADKERTLLENYVEVESWLARISDGQTSLEQLTISADGYIEGLPDTVGRLINQRVNPTYQAYAEKIRYLKSGFAGEYRSLINQCRAKYVFTNNHMYILGGK